MLWTIGHSNRPIGLFVEMLRSFSIEEVADVRFYPGSRLHPQFGSVALSEALAGEGIGYTPRRELGGRREPLAGSANTALPGGAFRGYADHMATAGFESAVAALLESSQLRRTAILCAEADPRQCHRSLLADYCVLQGREVRHILGTGECCAHSLHPDAALNGGTIRYVPGQCTLPFE